MDRSGAGKGSGEEAFGLISGVGVFFIQIAALVPGLLPFVGLLAVVMLVMALPAIAILLLGAVLIAPPASVFWLVRRLRRSSRDPGSSSA
jgi:hypothetical protein